MFKRMIAMAKWKANRKQNGPSMRDLDGSASFSWLDWYATKHNVTFMHAQTAYEIETIQPPGPAYILDPNEWRDWMRKHYPNTELGALSDAEQLLHKAYLKAIVEPIPEMVATGAAGTYLTLDWLDWYGRVAGCSFVRAEYEGIKTLVRRGVFVQGVTLTA